MYSDCRPHSLSRCPTGQLPPESAISCLCCMSQCSSSWEDTISPRQEPTKGRNGSWARVTPLQGLTLCLASSRGPNPICEIALSAHEPRLPISTPFPYNPKEARTKIPDFSSKQNTGGPTEVTSLWVALKQLGIMGTEGTKLKPYNAANVLCDLTRATLPPPCHTTSQQRRHWPSVSFTDHRL